MRKISVWINIVGVETLLESSNLVENSSSVPFLRNSRYKAYTIAPFLG